MESINPKGRKFVQPAGFVSIVAVGAGGEQVAHVLSTGFNQCRITKILYFTNQAGAVLTIGQNVAAVWTQRLPSINLVGGVAGCIPEEELPYFFFTDDIRIRSSAAAVAPNEVQVLLEVEEV